MGAAAVIDAHVRRHVVDVRLALPLDGVTALFGPSGAGKTTVLRTLAGLDRTTGHVRVDDEVWDDGRTFVPPRRRRVGYLFQAPALFPHLDPRANVAYGLHAVPRAERAGRVDEALAAAGAQHLAGRRSGELSGGEAQRVALARALAPHPRLLLLDEPLSALDAPTRAVLRADLRRLLVRQQVPTVVVTHDRTEALALADRVVVVVDGTVRQVGTPHDVFARPADPDVARVVGVETVVPGRVRGNDGGLVRVAVQDLMLSSAALRDDVVHRTGDDVLVCIRAEDVALDRPGRDTGASPRNRLPAVVTAVADEGALARVDLHAGFPLVAYVTRPALHDLGLAPGARVEAVVKSPAVHLVRRAA